MEKRNTERIEDVPTVETPEDVAVLYSWANLHGAKYRDFSASRREYRAQLRHRAAEQAREQELRAQIHAETAASIAERAARQAEEVAMSNQAEDTGYTHQQALQEAEEAARVATAERIEAARRAEAAAAAEAIARREEREIAEASASARRQAAQYAESEVRRRMAENRELEAQTTAAVPGEITDPYTPQSHAQPRQAIAAQPSPAREPEAEIHPRHRTESAPTHPAPPVHVPPVSHAVEYAPAPQTQATPAAAPARRPQGYRPDDASGVRQIYRGPEFETPRANTSAPSGRQPVSGQEPSRNTARPAQDPRAQAASAPVRPQERASAWSDGVAAATRPGSPATSARQPAPGSATPALPPPYASGRGSSEAAPPRSAPPLPKAASPFSLGETDASTQDPTPRRRRQDAPGYKEEHPSDSGTGSRRKEDAYRYGAAPQQPAAAPSRRPPVEAPEPASLPEPTGPAWLYASAPQMPPKPAPAPPQSSVADTLQQSRERVAARWYALKGVFEQPGQERSELAPVRQKETRTPVLAIFSLAGGVGKTSLVATLGRSLSSLGEKVLLTDTTSHGLLPFYFGASELRQGTVRTFSPPSGSTDAPIYLVSYDVEQKSNDEAAQEALVEEITASSRGTHRVLLDLSVSSGWIVRRMARLSPTILVPVSPDMNSVISLQAVEKFFDGVVDSEGRPLKLFYLLNQFDASLPLHLDIREVLRRQLGERLLPFVIRRAPAVGEALAEGMTIVDYSPEAPVAEDYLNAATWLRTVAAPATAGFRNVRWSER